MTNTDYTAFFQDLMSGKAFDMPAANDVFGTMTAYQAKMNRIALETAEKNAELSYGWMKETLTKMEAFTDSKQDPSELAKTSADVLSSAMRSAPEHVAKFAEVAKQAQTDTVELVMEAGKDLQGEAVAAAKKASAKATKAAKAA
jgi:hypothetical protein